MRGRLRKFKSNNGRKIKQPVVDLYKNTVKFEPGISVIVKLFVKKTTLFTKKMCI